MKYGHRYRIKGGRFRGPCSGRRRRRFMIANAGLKEFTAELGQPSRQEDSPAETPHDKPADPRRYGSFRDAFASYRSRKKTVSASVMALFAWYRRKNPLTFEEWKAERERGKPPRRARTFEEWKADRAIKRSRIPLRKGKRP